MLFMYPQCLSAQSGANARPNDPFVDGYAIGDEERFDGGESKDKGRVEEPVSLLQSKSFNFFF